MIFLCLLLSKSVSGSLVQGSYWSRPSFIPKDQAFRNYTIAKLTTKTLFTCIHYCVQNDRCYSFNYGVNVTTDNCELNSRLVDPKGRWMTEATGWMYYEINSIEVRGKALDAFLIVHFVFHKKE